MVTRFTAGLAVASALTAVLISAAPAAAQSVEGRPRYYPQGPHNKQWNHGPNTNGGRYVSPPGYKGGYHHWKPKPAPRPYYYYRPVPPPAYYYVPPPPACWWVKKQVWVDTYYGPELVWKNVKVCR